MGREGAKGLAAVWTVGAAVEDAAVSRGVILAVDTGSTLVDVQKSGAIDSGLVPLVFAAGANVESRNP